MYIEQKSSGKYLIKKHLQKKFWVKIWEDFITEETILNITKKECDFIFESEKFISFEKQVYNNNTLKEIVFKSIFLTNNIEALKLFEDKKEYINKKSLWQELSKSEILYKQWHYFKWWLYNSFPIKFIYHSNNMEGSKIPHEEVEKIIENKKYTYKVKNEIQEVKNSKLAWDFLNTKFIFNEANIKKIYHILTKDLLQETWVPYPRWFKKVVNVANNNPTTHPDNVIQEINSLLDYYKNNRNNIFSLQLAFDFHLKYEQIHPFENGNGRTGRFFMNKILLQTWMLPIIVFKDNYKSYSNSIASCNSWNKKKYYKFMLEQYKKTLDELYNFEIWIFEHYNKSFIKIEKYLSKK
jgi:hypothetical protein